MIDTHAHLGPDEAPALLGRARAAGVERVIAVGTTLAGCREALAVCAAAAGVFAALGIHPHEAETLDHAALVQLRGLLAGEPAAVAVGETGLDYFRDYAPRELQRRAFVAQVGLADELGLPLVVHSRAAELDTLAVLEGFPGRVVCHCFSSPAMLEAVLARGYYVSFAGNLTYPNAAPLRHAAAEVPLERLLVETDSPYLTPQPLRGSRNEPAFVVHTLSALADLRGLPAAELAAQIDSNADAAFGL